MQLSVADITRRESCTGGVLLTGRFLITRRETCSTSILSAIPTWAALGSNSDLGGERPAIHRGSRSNLYNFHCTKFSDF